MGLSDRSSMYGGGYQPRELPDRAARALPAEPSRKSASWPGPLCPIRSTTSARHAHGSPKPCRSPTNGYCLDPCAPSNLVELLEDLAAASDRRWSRGASRAPVRSSALQRYPLQGRRAVQLSKEDTGTALTRARLTGIGCDRSTGVTSASSAQAEFDWGSGSTWRSQWPSGSSPRRNSKRHPRNSA